MAGFNLSEYATVAERLSQFWSDHPNGRVSTSVGIRDDGAAFCQAFVYRDMNDPFPASSGHAVEALTNQRKLDEFQIERGETSAVGRALALMGYSIKKGIASAQEMEKVQRVHDQEQEARNMPLPAASKISDEDVKIIEDLCRELLRQKPDARSDLMLKFVELGVHNTDISLNNIIRSLPTVESVTELAKWVHNNSPAVKDETPDAS